MTFGSLFAGIGGMDLGLERAGIKCVWQVEIDPYATKVLEKHWPDVRRWDDVRTFPPEPAIDWTCDVIAGGFPCQPVATGGQKRVDADDRWLWPEFARIIRILRPRIVLLENVAALLDRGMGIVLSDLVKLGHDAEWGVLSACAFGAPHTRRRVFLVSHANGIYGKTGIRCFAQRQEKGERKHVETLTRNWLDAFSGVAGMVDGVPNRMDRIRTLGNAVVPQVAEWIGKRLMALAGVAGVL